MTQVMSLPLKAEEKQVEVPVKKQLVKLNFNAEAEAEKRKKKTLVCEGIVKKMGSRIERNKETKIGWFRYFKAAEFILTDDEGNKQTYVKHKWAKIPTPDIPKVTKSSKVTKCSKVSKSPKAAKSLSLKTSR